MRNLRIASLFALAASAANAQGAKSPGAVSINIPFERMTLPNGLNVILSPDHTIPQVAGFVLNKSETPFAPLYWDRYEQIKTPTR